MPKVDLVKAIIRYQSNFTSDKKFVYGKITKGDSARYLLLKRREDKHPKNIGKWECAGGGREKGETPMKTLTRELEEELKWEKDKDYGLVKWLPQIRNCAVALVYAFSDKLDISNLSSEHFDYMWIKAEDFQKQDLVEFADLLLPYFNNPERYLDK
jgi:8-oxo-dGTP pyrophosphatase MutT (NUDIX family)